MINIAITKTFINISQTCYIDLVKIQKSGMLSYYLIRTNQIDIIEAQELIDESGEI